MIALVENLSIVEYTAASSRFALQYLVRSSDEISWDADASAVRIERDLRIHNIKFCFVQELLLEADHDCNYYGQA